MKDFDQDDDDDDDDDAGDYLSEHDLIDSDCSVGSDFGDYEMPLETELMEDEADGKPKRRRRKAGGSGGDDDHPLSGKRQKRTKAMKKEDMHYCDICKKHFSDPEIHEFQQHRKEVVTCQGRRRSRTKHEQEKEWLGM